MAFTYTQLHGFFVGNKRLMRFVLNDMELELVCSYYGEGNSPYDSERQIEATAAKFGKPASAARNSLRTGREKVEQRYRLVRDYDLFEQDTIGHLPISRTEVLRQLCKNGFINIEQLRIAQDAELLAIPGIGDQILAEIRQAVEAHDREIAERPVVVPKKKPKPILSAKWTQGSRPKRPKPSHPALAI